MTNGDKIRQMSNEELVGLFYPNCHFCVYYMETCGGDFFDKGAKKESLPKQAFAKV